MTIYELGKELKKMYNNAPTGYQVANIHFFGVVYAEIINENNYRISEIVDAAGINKSYTTEVSKGIKLSRYVVPKEY